MAIYTRDTIVARFGPHWEEIFSKYETKLGTRFVCAVDDIASSHDLGRNERIRQAKEWLNNHIIGKWFMSEGCITFFECDAEALAFSLAWTIDE